ncbi:TIGR04222 domain-containing membrane protein [Streptomyces sp. URMC 124]|uniref:TIGR04222 domain-containing membrane protein n=1 Tax=Streptomyces sp. URMC 124 TaxID=3423405 RepID=UPI003F1E0BA4
MNAGIVVAALVTLLALVAPSARLVVARRRALADPPPAQGEPELLEVAFLLGGRGRAVDTVIAGMCDDGRISVSDSGRLTVERAAAHNAVERALLGRCSADWSISLRRVRTSLQFDAAVDALEGALVRRGMLVSPQVKQDWQRAADVQVGGLVLTGVGVVALIVMPAAGVPALAVLALLAGGIVLRVRCRPTGPKVQPTPRGKAFTDRIRTKGPWSVRASGAHPEGVAGVVAVHGAGAPEPDLPFLVQLRKAASSNAGVSSGHSLAKTPSRKSSKSSKASKSSYAASSSASSCSSSSGYGCSSTSSCSSHSGHSGHSSCSSSSCSSGSSSSCGGGSSCGS